MSLYLTLWNVSVQKFNLKFGLVLRTNSCIKIICFPNHFSWTQNWWSLKSLYVFYIRYIRYIRFLYIWLHQNKVFYNRTDSIIKFLKIYIATIYWILLNLIQSLTTSFVRCLMHKRDMSKEQKKTNISWCSTRAYIFSHNQTIICFASIPYQINIIA